MGNRLGKSKLRPGTAEQVSGNLATPDSKAENQSSSKDIVHDSSSSQWPYKNRLAAINAIRKVISKKEIKKEDWESRLRDLQKVIGQAEGDIVEDSHDGQTQKGEGIFFRVDELGDSHVRNLGKVVSEKKHRWRDEADFTCRQLTTHYSPPPAVSAKMPKTGTTDLTDITLTKINFYNNQKKIRQLGKLLDDNQGLVNLELGFTGITTHELRLLLPHIIKMPDLSYLGLRGNRIHAAILKVFIEYLRDANYFPSLKWIDIQNNVDIYYLPMTFLNMLKYRWPREGIQPSFRDLAEGKAVVIEDMMELNI